ncbi:hypothetical protein RND81_08G144000 [Saponaria officinalis]|uniref:Uncharacterized protein n=1 Tax=Saponaria officinalis TaxID=3572 RepID=A0AAW1J799_SAPOF
MNSTKIIQVSETFIKPKHVVQHSKQPYHLAPMDLSMLSLQYIQEGLMFTKPSHFKNGEIFSIQTFLHTLMDSLSLTLVHFYPLAGRLETCVDEESHQSLVFVNCTKGPGARFVHATLGVTVSDILLPSEIPSLVHSFFDNNEDVNYNGHEKPFLSVRVTELLDGVFIACSMNHSVQDGTSYWHFWNVWSQIHNIVHAADINSISSSNKESNSINLPVHNRWFPDGYGPKVTLPYTNPKEFIRTYKETNNVEKMFHFSSESLAKLKAQTRKESGNDLISSWKSIVVAKGLADDQIFNCILVANNRHRLSPNLPKHYYGNCIGFVDNKVKAKDVVAQPVGWAASLLQQSVARHDDKVVRECVANWMKSRAVYHPAKLFDSNTIMITHSPRFDMYGNEFGLGKPIAVRSGYGYKFGGVVAAYPASEGDGSIDIEVCLPSHTMIALQSDTQFMKFVSLQSN